MGHRNRRGVLGHETLKAYMKLNMRIPKRLYDAGSSWTIDRSAQCYATLSVATPWGFDMPCRYNEAIWDEASRAAFRERIDVGWNVRPHAKWRG